MITETSETPLESDDVAYPCKGCGEILEEGKAFELAGHRWHIECFRCNTCATLLDSDANLLLLGDGSLICNDCTYSCSACNNKIEDLAILTGDQAFCANCFRCRNCKKKIENLRYARTSQGIFCMECHEALMARRRKKTSKSARAKPSNSSLLDKSLPSLPPSARPTSNLSSMGDATTPTELPGDMPAPRPKSGARTKGKPPDLSPAPSDSSRRDMLTTPASSHRRSASHRSASEVGDDFYIPMALDPNPALSLSPSVGSHLSELAADEARRPTSKESGTTLKDYFSATSGRSSRPTSENQKHELKRTGSLSQQRTTSKPNRVGHDTSREAADGLDHVYQQSALSNDLRTVASTKRSASSSTQSARRTNGEVASVEACERRASDSSAKDSSSLSTTDAAEDMSQRGAEEITARAMTPHDTPKSHEKSKPQGKPLQRQSKQANDSPQPPTIAIAAPSAATTTLAAVPPNPDAFVSASTESATSNSIDTRSPSVENDDDDEDTSPNATNPGRPVSSPRSTLQVMPQRGDSLPKPPLSVSARRDSGPNHMRMASAVEQTASSSPLANIDSPTLPLHVSGGVNGSSVNGGVNGGRAISRPMESPVSRGSMDAPHDGESNDRLGAESFVSPRNPPHPPHDSKASHAATDSFKHGHKSLSPQSPSKAKHTANSASMSSAVERMSNGNDSPNLPRYSLGGDFSMADDLTRILGDDGQDHTSFLKRVSNSVRHGRSYSDRGSRHSRDGKWTKSPLAGTVDPLASSVTPSPDLRDDSASLRAELRKERHKSMLHSQKIAELEALVDGKQQLRQMNAELREKRTTMIVLDTQKELVIRELELMTDHLARSKDGKRGPDVEVRGDAMLREFARSLDALRSSYEPRIELVAKQLQDAQDEYQKQEAALNKLLRERKLVAEEVDAKLYELEILSAKNVQFTEINNQLVHQIRDMRKEAATASATPSAPSSVAPTIDVSTASTSNSVLGLGIYANQQKDRTTATASLSGTTTVSDPSRTSASTLTRSGAEDPDSESSPAAASAIVVRAPQVVNVQKSHPRKFNWKKQGQNVGKGITKSLKALTASDANRNQPASQVSQQQQSFRGDDPLIEGIPYGAMALLDQPSTTAPPASKPTPPVENTRQGFGLFGGPKSKGAAAAQQQQQQQQQQKANGLGVKTVQHPSILFGSELTARAEYEHVNIPAIVTRCIEEVELRGMDVEGIYRKSGGSAAIQQIRDGFQARSDYDISDPDLDIAAVSSALKKYFYELPTPLVAAPAYDLLLRAPQHADLPLRVAAARIGVSHLPPRHRDALAFVMFHLARVARGGSGGSSSTGTGGSGNNLMSAGNCAVVFAPTLMRHADAAQDAADTAMKIAALALLIEACDEIFLGGGSANGANRTGPIPLPAWMRDGGPTGSAGGSAGLGTLSAGNGNGNAGAGAGAMAGGRATTPEPPNASQLNQLNPAGMMHGMYKPFSTPQGEMMTIKARSGEIVTMLRRDVSEEDERAGSRGGFY